ncbi:RNA polymerase sigma factor RpoD [Streptomyces tendae]
MPEIADPSKVAPKDARELSKLFFEQLTVLEEGTPEYQYARNTLIEMNMSLVRFAAGRFRSRGPEEMEDIVQVGMIGLIKAIDRFELTREVEFTSFAVPYIVGEIKRFFRGHLLVVPRAPAASGGPRPAGPGHRGSRAPAWAAPPPPASCRS